MRRKPTACSKLFFAQARHLFFQVFSSLERTVLVTVDDNILGHRLTEAGDPRQQRTGSGIDVHAHGVDAVLDSRIQRPGQLVLIYIVLVLANPNRFRLDLDQFGQRVPATGERLRLPRAG